MVEGRGSVCQLHFKYTKRSKRWGVFDPSPPLPRHHSISFSLYNCFFLFWIGDTTHCIIETRRQHQQHNSNNNTPTKAARTATGLRLFFIIVFRCLCRCCYCGCSSFACKIKVIKVITEPKTRKAQTTSIVLLMLLLQPLPGGATHVNPLPSLDWTPLGGTH